MRPTTELRNLIEAIQDGTRGNEVLGWDIMDILGLVEKLGRGHIPLKNAADAIALAEAAFPGEFWELDNKDNHPRYVEFAYTASVGGKITKSVVSAGSDRPEKALVLAVLSLKLRQVEEA